MRGRCRRCRSPAPTTRRWRERRDRTQMPPRRRERESCRLGATSVTRGAEANVDAAASRERRPAHRERPGAIRSRKQLARFLFERERNAEVVLEERALLVQRPGAQHAAQQVRRRVGDEAIGCEHRGQHVAAAAAADQDLAAAVLGPFDQHGLRAAPRQRRPRRAPRRRRQPRPQKAQTIIPRARLTRVKARANGGDLAVGFT